MCCRHSLELKCWCINYLCYQFFHFAVVVDVVTELAMKGVLSELLSSNDLVLMSETMGNSEISLRNRRRPLGAKI